MSELSEQEKQLLADMIADEEAEEAAERNKDESERVKQMPSYKIDFPLGIIPDADSTTNESD